MSLRLVHVGFLWVVVVVGVGESFEGCVVQPGLLEASRLRFNRLPASVVNSDSLLLKYGSSFRAWNWLPKVEPEHLWC